MCVRSRSGHIITLGGAPIVWGSKLQTKTALSTMEAESIALSTAMRQFLPTKSLITEILKAYGIERDEAATVTTVWEDNNGALILANTKLPKLTPQIEVTGSKISLVQRKGA